MRWALMLALALLASGCSVLLDFSEDQLVDGGAAAGDGGDGGFDGGADGGLDGRVIDAGRDGGGGGVLCGTVTCPASQDCCRVGTAGSCVPRGQACSGISLSCDGTEDCPTAGDVCCGILPSGPAECLPVGIGVASCSGRMEDFRIILCNDAADCPTARPLCQICGTGALQRYCTDSIGTGCH